MGTSINVLYYMFVFSLITYYSFLDSCKVLHQEKQGNVSLCFGLKCLVFSVIHIGYQNISNVFIGQGGGKYENQMAMIEM